jgi:hypothetical protein
MSPAQNKRYVATCAARRSFQSFGGLHMRIEILGKSIHKRIERMHMCGIENNIKTIFIYIAYSNSN